MILFAAATEVIVKRYVGKQKPIPLHNHWSGSGLCIREQQSRESRMVGLVGCYSLLRKPALVDLSFPQMTPAYHWNFEIDIHVSRRSWNDAPWVRRSWNQWPVLVRRYVRSMLTEVGVFGRR